MPKVKFSFCGVAHVPRPSDVQDSMDHDLDDPSVIATSIADADREMTTTSLTLSPALPTMHPRPLYISFIPDDHIDMLITCNYLFVTDCQFNLFSSIFDRPA